MIGALLLVMPFGGMRVICVAAPEEATDSTQASKAKALTECERLCPLHESSESSSGSDKTDCALSAGASSLMASGTVALIRSIDPPLAPEPVRVEYTLSPRFAPEPELPRFGPPPKS